MAFPISEEATLTAASKRRQSTEKKRGILGKKNKTKQKREKVEVLAAMIIW